MMVLVAVIAQEAAPLGIAYAQTVCREPSAVRNGRRTDDRGDPF